MSTSGIGAITTVGAVGVGTSLGIAPVAPGGDTFIPS